MERLPLTIGDAVEIGEKGGHLLARGARIAAEIVVVIAVPIAEVADVVLGAAHVAAEGVAQGKGSHQSGPHHDKRWMSLAGRWLISPRQQVDAAVLVAVALQAVGPCPSMVVQAMARAAAADRSKG